MVKVGDVVEATGTGATFIRAFIGGSGIGEVLHVSDGSSPTHPLVIQSISSSEGLSSQALVDGIIYYDTELEKPMWLDDGDFSVK